MLKKIIMMVLVFLGIAFFFFGLTQRIAAEQQSQFAKQANGRMEIAEAALIECKKLKN